MTVALVLSLLALDSWAQDKAIDWDNKVKYEPEITYATTDGVNLQLDLARPSKGDGPFPALIYIFGSGWGHWGGSKAICFDEIITAAHRGYVAVAINYRQTTFKINGRAKYQFPDQLYDAKAAVRWLRANSQKYHIDAERIGTVGFSSGGHLALLLGLTTPSDGLEGNLGDLKLSSKVAAVVNSGGPTDLGGEFTNPDSVAAIGELLGGPRENNKDRCIKASPITYVRTDAPPILTIHGELDSDIPLDQAKLLDKKMREIGGSHELIIKTGVGHMDFAEDPDAFAFLDRNLKR